MCICMSSHFIRLYGSKNKREQQEEFKMLHDIVTYPATFASLDLSSIFFELVDTNAEKFMLQILKQEQLVALTFSQ